MVVDDGGDSVSSGVASVPPARSQAGLGSEVTGAAELATGPPAVAYNGGAVEDLSLIHISEPTRLALI
eukprot:11990539-Alexandrium_andersonii.AAC.1